MWMGWKPLSLPAYLLELERGIWEQTNNHFWKRKILTLSAPRGIYHSIMWDSSTHAEQTPGWIKTNSLISRCAHPLPPFAVAQTMATALTVQDLTLTSLDQWTGSQELRGAWLRRVGRDKRLPLSTANQKDEGWNRGETWWNNKRRLRLDSVAVQAGTREAAALTCNKHSTVARK